MQTYWATIGALYSIYFSSFVCHILITSYWENVFMLWFQG